MKSKSAPSYKGLLAGGNWIIDQVKLIDTWPQPGMLSNIRQQTFGTGGAPFNVLVGLAKSGVDFPLYGTGLIGQDALGKDILSICKENHIDTRLIGVTHKAPTSFTDVMTEQGGGRRTFFHARGANALWRGDDLNFEKLRPRIFHLGYLLLLDVLDEPDAKFGTKAARLLAQAQAAGVRTSVDVVSENSDRFARIVNPALKHVDYCILNEIEAGRTTGFKVRDEQGNLDTVAVKHAAGALLQQGVKEIVVIHFPEGAFARTRKGEDHWQSSVKIPADFIAGTAGAGDAFCGGVLMALHEGWDLQKALQTGVCIAAASLSQASCTDGIKSLSSSLALGKKYGYRPPVEPADS